MRRACVMLMLATPFVTMLGGTANGQAASWVAAWSASQEALNSTTLTNRTVRMMARVTVGGMAVRVRLDNSFATTPVTIGSAAIGIQRVSRSGDSSTRSAALVAGSNRPLRFNGSASVVLPPGGSVRSDPVTLTVLPQQDLAVSLYVPDSSVHASAHTSAQVRSYMTANSAGDKTADESKTAFTSSTTNMFWLKAIEVQSTTGRGAIAAFGDSITDGTCSTVDGHDRWEDWLATRLDTLDGPGAKAVLNEGIGGNTLTTVRANAGVSRLDRDVLGHPGLTDVLLFLGTNDINRGASQAQILAGFQDVINRVHARGARAFGVTILPRADVAPAGTWTSAKSQIRNDVNQWIRTSGAFDGVLDFDRAVSDPLHPDALAPALNCDDVHPSPRGYYEIGKSIVLAIVH